MKGKVSEKKSLEYDAGPSVYVKNQDSTEKKCCVISQHTCIFQNPGSGNGRGVTFIIQVYGLRGAINDPH